ncbi:carbohydrate ABC transporter permease [Anaerotaenia torta]|uniref:carbohydrate ABC transporter permease n=1 Tax=Anaerotaenia torta TaxID=433293 RepID=UPI003D1C05DF
MMNRNIKSRKTNSWSMDRFGVADIIIMLFITLLCLTCILPFLHVAAKSISSDTAVLAKEVYFWPKGFVFAAYERVFKSAILMRQLGFTALITLLQTALRLTLLALCAYPLSRRYLPGRWLITLYILISMYFGAGLIPFFLTLKNLNLIDTIWVLILPGGFSAFDMIIMRTFFMNSIPDSLEESAIIDGASHFRILTQIYIPLSKPVFATLALFAAVGRWNGFGDAMYFVSDRKLHPIQLFLYNMILSAKPSETLLNESQIGVVLPPETLQAAMIMFATIPILIVYPFLQKYFVKGVMIGAVKG